jgi:hypothetical protein
MVPACKLVLLNEFLWNVCDFDVAIFWVGHRGIKIEVPHINGAEVCSFLQENTVEKEIDKLKISSVGADVTRVAYAIAFNGDPGAIRIIFLWTNFTYHHGLAYFLPHLGQYVLIVDEEEGVSATH